MSKLIWQIFFGIALILVVILSILNSHEVSFDYFFSTTSAPLIVILAVAFVLGLLCGSAITKFVSISKKK